MFDHLDIHQTDQLIGDQLYDRFVLNIFLNDPTITKENMYEKDFDPHYLVDYHIKRYLPYFNIDKVILKFIVWGPDGNIITSYIN